jgi:prepilin-type N-terminal cleavage/methylation domain-containing protein
MSRIDRKREGFTLIELLVSVVAVATLMVGTVKFFVIQNRTHAQQEQRQVMEENIRLASSMITDALRNSRYGAPTSNLNSWISWVPSFSGAANPTNPLLTAGANSTTPDTISVAACFSNPVATLSAQAASGATTLSATNAINQNAPLSDVLDTNSKRLIRIGEGSEFAQVTSVGSNTIGIDTDPTTVGAQGISQASGHPIGANICRVDVITFSVGTDSSGVSRLLRDDNQGSGPQPTADDITLLKITSTPPIRYQIALTAQTENPDPVTGAAVTRSMSTTVTLRN